jgi:hypothetical protein
MRSSLGVPLVVLLVSCAAPSPPEASVAQGAGVNRGGFQDDVAFLEKRGALTVLTSDSGGRVAVSPGLQGRVMTSAVSADGASLGWVNRPFLEAGKTGTAFDNYGGEDRFWLGPEGGQFGLYFKPGDPYAFDKWQTPPALNQGTWDVKSSTASSVVLTRAMHVQNHSGATFDVGVERTVSVLSRAAAAAALGVELPSSVQVVAFETRNQIQNAGHDAWTKEKGLLSIWILGMYAPSPDAHVVIPFDPAVPGDIVNDRYFGKVPPERLSVHAKEGFLSFTCDGTLRSKIGLRSDRARSPLASYSPSARLLTFVQYDKPVPEQVRRADGSIGPKTHAYVNSMWEEQAEPYGGDIVNSYNDGPTAPGKPSLGGFYEIESSSPAAILGPGESTVHTHRTFHLVGDPAALEPIARKVLGLGLADFSR